MCNVLIACEESQTVCNEFRKLGFNAFSCDLQKCSGGHPEWHILDNVLHVLEPWHDENMFHIMFFTQDGELHSVKHWDLIIAHPPCTDLAICGAPSFRAKQIDGRQFRSIDFFMKFTKLSCRRVCIENPVGIMSNIYRKPDQIVQPYFFGDPQRKRTCLWLKGLPNLVPTNIVEPIIIKYKNGKGTDDPWHMNSLSMPAADRSRFRSKTFQGLAIAMANQWGNVINGACR